METATKPIGGAPKAPPFDVLAKPPRHDAIGYTAKPFRTFTINRDPSPFLTFPTTLDAVIEISVFDQRMFSGSFEIRYARNIKSYQIKTWSFAVTALTACADLLARLAEPKMFDCTADELVELLKELNFIDATPQNWSAA